MTRPHECPGGCGENVPAAHLACRVCWWRLPRPLRDAVRSAFRVRLSRPGEHHAAMQAAIVWFHDNGCDGG